MKNHTFTFAACLLLLLCWNTAVLGQEKAIACGTLDENRPAFLAEKLRTLPQIAALQNARTAAGEMMVCRLSIDIDSYTYLKYGRDTAAIRQRVIQIVGKASLLYENEINTRLVVTQIRIFKDTGPDPYLNQSDVSTLLGILAGRQLSDFNFDKRMFLYTKPFTGSASGMAYIAGQYSVAPLEDVATIMHELAHTFGSLHTNSCDWPGGPLDYCGSIEGSCYDKALDITTNGTFMSRCGGAVSFHPMSQAIMKDHAETNGYSKIAFGPSTITLPGNFTAVKGDFYVWPLSLRAKSYEVSYALQSDFSGETVETTPVNGLALTKMTVGSEYYFRVRAINHLGTSDWSNTIRILIDPTQPDIPTIVSPAPNSFVPGIQATTLTFSPVSGATSYRVQVTGVYNPEFRDAFTETVTGTSYTFYPQTGGYQWRVKAIRDGQEGRWSETGYFSANARLNTIGLFAPIPASLTNVPRSFPFTYQPSNYMANIRISIADNPGFSNALFQKTYTPFSEITDLVKNLPANTQLYFRVQESNTNRTVYPDFNFVDYTFPFSTGPTTPSSDLVFMSGLDQSRFGGPNPKIAVSKEHIWMPVLNYGYLKINQKTLNYQAYTRAGTDGLIGNGLDVSVHTDDARNVHMLSQGNYNSFWSVKLDNEVPSPTATVNRFYHFTSYIGDFNPQNKLHWSQQTIYREGPSSLTTLKQIPETQYIRQLRTFGTKAWIVLQNASLPNHEIMVMDLNDPNNVQKIDYTTSPAIDDYIEQIEIQPNGHVWLRQTDMWTNANSIARFDGTSWSVFNAGNSTLGSQIPGMGLSPDGDVYVLSSGSESQVWKYGNNTWQKAGEAMPYSNFGGDLFVDANESLWISGRYGLSRLALSDALPVTIVDFGAAPEGNGVLLSWQVADEVDMQRYVVEHSVDARSFAPITETPAAGGSLYSAFHANPGPGIHYYRLKCIETDRDFAYSKIAKVDLGGSLALFAFPNPVADRLQIRLTSDMAGQAGTMSIVSAAGRLIWESRTDRLKETETVDVSKLLPGTYLMRIESNGKAVSRTVNIVR